jgi:hypothetical protein
MKIPVKWSLLEDLLQDLKILEVERRKLQSTSLKELRGGHRGSGWERRLCCELYKPCLHKLISEVIANWS